MGGATKYVIAVIFAAVIIFIFAVALGTRLGELASPTSDTTPESTSEPQHAPKMPVIIAMSRPLIIPSESSDTTAESGDTSTEIPDTSSPTPPTQNDDPAISYNAISLLLRSFGEDSKALMHYSSPLSVKYNMSSPDTVDLKTALDAMQLSQSYLSGVFALESPKADAAEKALAREYEMTMLCEIAEYGIDEVVLLGFSADADGLAEAAEFTNELLSRVGSADFSVGIALSSDFFEKDDAKEMIRTSGISAFLALDLYSHTVPALMTAEDVIINKLTACKNTITDYNLRILVGCGNAPDLDAQVKAVLGQNVYNIQAVGK